jgi:hypothetical protein
MDLTVCHPALRLSWFRSIDDDSYYRAKEVFEYHLQEYQAATPESAPPQPVSDRPATGSNTFLASIARRSSSSLLTTAVPKPASELERYTLFEHGIQETDALENPLLWWKVSILKYLICKLLRNPS